MIHLDTVSPVGLVIPSMTPPEQVPHVAAMAERLGFGELWLPEDYFFLGGMAGATAALAATSRIPVGLGVVSAMARHPALLAMELATMERLYPGRVWPGVGLGAPGWVKQMGLMPTSSLSALRETMTSLRSLLAGETVSLDGGVFTLNEIALTHPPVAPPPLYAGVLGPKMLSLAGEVADGTVVSVLAGAQYVRWLRDRIAEGQAIAARANEPHRVATFVLYCVDHDAERAKQGARAVTAFYLSAVPKSPLTDVLGIGDELWDMYERGGADAAALIAREMPDEWLDELAIAGAPDECAVKIEALLAAGSDSVVLYPVPLERMTAITELTAAEVLPRVAVVGSRP